MVTFIKPLYRSCPSVIIEKHNAPTDVDRLTKAQPGSYLLRCVKRMEISTE